MKVEILADFIRSIGKMMSVAQADDKATSLLKLSKMFDGRETMTVVRFFAQTMPSEELTAQQAGQLTNLLDIMGEIKPALKSMAKPAFEKDFVLFETFLARVQHLSVDEIIAYVEERKVTNRVRRAPALNMDVVRQYIHLFEKNYKSADKFPVVFENMEKDRKVRKQEAAAIADQFAYKTSKSTPKKEALNRIWSVYENYQSSIAREKAQGGRSAA